MLKSRMLELLEPCLDSSMPQLATALDDNMMLGFFASHLLALGLVWGWRVVQCGIEKIYYHPHKRCGILYHLRFRDASESEADEWVYGEMLPPGDDQKRYKKMAATGQANHSACDCLNDVPAVSLWKDFNMILRVFPSDLELEFMTRTVDPSFIKSTIETHLPSFGFPGDTSTEHWRCDEAHYDHIKLLPGKRCVLRHHAKLVGPARETRELRFYSKTYANGKARPSFELLQTAYDNLAVGAEHINIPKPLFYLEGYHTYWQEEWPGRALSEAVMEYDWGGLFPRIATVLSTMHRKRIEGLAPAPTIEKIFREVSRDAMKLVNVLPQEQGLMGVILKKLYDRKSIIEAHGMPSATIHGACRLEQILIRGEELALIDFDALAQGDPLSDIGEFIASLQYLELSRGFSRARINQGIAKFSESYAAQTPWSCDPQRVAWYVLAFMITKMYSATKNLDSEALFSLKNTGGEICAGWLARL